MGLIFGQQCQDTLPHWMSGMRSSRQNNVYLHSCVNLLVLQNSDLFSNSDTHEADLQRSFILTLILTPCIAPSVKSLLDVRRGLPKGWFTCWAEPQVVITEHHDQQSAIEELGEAEWDVSVLSVISTICENSKREHMINKHNREKGNNVALRKAHFSPNSLQHS